MSVANVGMRRMFWLLVCGVFAIAPAGYHAGAQAKLKAACCTSGRSTTPGTTRATRRRSKIIKANLPDVEVIESRTSRKAPTPRRVMENMIKQGAKLIIAASFGLSGAGASAVRRSTRT